MTAKQNPSDAYWYALRKDAGLPAPAPDPPRGSLTEGRDITAAFTELIREGKACQYALLQRAVQQAFPFQWSQNHWNDRWRGFATERDGLLKSFSSDGGGEAYEGTLRRALRTWTAIVKRPVTDEEAREWEKRDRAFGDYHEKSVEGLLEHVAHDYRIHCIREGIEDPKGKGLRRYRVDHFSLPDATNAELLKHFELHSLPPWYRNGSTVDQFLVDGPDVEGLPKGAEVIPTSAAVSTEERHRLWITEFTAEVELCVERFTDHRELPHELGRLIAELKAFEVCAGEGRVLLQHLQSTGAGMDVLRKVADNKARLLLGLEELRDEYAPKEVPQPADRYRWNGTVGELCGMFAAIHGAGWIAGKRAHVARLVCATFTDKDGKAYEPTTIDAYLKPSSVPPMREGVEFAATKCPKDV